MTQLIISNSAQHDLADIVAYVAGHDPQAATKLVARLRTAIHALAERPEAYPKLLGSADIRQRVIGRYNIYYRATPERVEILRVLHAARDRDPLLGG